MPVRAQPLIVSVVGKGTGAAAENSGASPSTISVDGDIAGAAAVGQPGFVFDRCEGVHFADCTVRRLDALVDGGKEGQLLFQITMDEAVQFVRGAIRGNRTNRVANSKLLLVREGTDERDNGPDVEVKREEPR
jgi:hypothetical protein